MFTIQKSPVVPRWFIVETQPGQPMRMAGSLYGYMDAYEAQHALDVLHVRTFYGDEAAQLVSDGWTIDSAIDHVTGGCDHYLCTHPAHREG